MCITSKYGLDFDAKCPFKAPERPILSSIGIVYGDLYRISQACSTLAIFKASLHKRIQHWIGGFMMHVSFVSNTILRWWEKHSLGVMIRYGWEPQSLHEGATVAAFTMHLRDILGDSLLSRSTKRIEDDALDDGSLRCTRGHQLPYSLASNARGKGSPCCCCCTCRQVDAAVSALFNAVMTLCSGTPCT